MKNVKGIAITIRAFLPTGKTIDEQFAALSLVKDAHASGDYSALLKAAKIDEVKSESKTRREEETPPSGNDPEQGGDGKDGKGADPNEGGEQTHDPEPAKPAGQAAADADVPEFLKKGKKSA